MWGVYKDSKIPEKEKNQEGSNKLFAELYASIEAEVRQSSV